MNPVTKGFHSAFIGIADDRLVVVWDLALWFGVDADHAQVAPYLLQQLVEAPSVTC